MEDFNTILEETNEEYFYNTLKKFGATDDEINTLKEDHPDLKNKCIKLKLEDKLNILYIFGFDIHDILIEPYVLYKSIASLVCKCEMALLEEIEPNTHLLRSTKHRHIFANYAARKKGYLPANYNIFINADTTSSILGIGKGKYLAKFYKNKNIQDVHKSFKSSFPDFYDELITIDEYKYLISEENKPQSSEFSIANSLSKTKTNNKPNFSVIKRPICYSTNRKRNYKQEELSK